MTVYNNRMEMEKKYEFLGSEAELSNNEVTLNTLPNDQILELCIQIRKRNSLIRDWSNCSNKATLRTRIIESIMPTTLPTTTRKVTMHNRKRERQIILISAVLLFSSVLCVAYFLKKNLAKIRYHIDVT